MAKQVEVGVREFTTFLCVVLATIWIAGRPEGEPVWLLYMGAGTFLVLAAVVYFWAFREEPSDG